MKYRYKRRQSFRRRYRLEKENPYFVEMHKQKSANWLNRHPDYYTTGGDKINDPEWLYAALIRIRNSE